MQSDEHLPQFLYRYQSIDNNLKSALNDNYQWFSDPLNFNDPYDCNLSNGIYLERDKELMINFYTSINENLKLNGEGHLSKDELSIKVEELYKNSDFRKDNIRKMNAYKISKAGICCFSMSDNILLMWSHYSNKHGGICLKFDTNKDIHFFSIPYIVTYSLQLPKFDLYRNAHKILAGQDSGLFQHLFATKSNDWKYESEVRVMKEDINGKYRGEIEFKKEALVEVVFGYKTKQNDIDDIVVILRRNNYNASLSQMRLKENDFGLEKVQLDY